MNGEFRKTSILLVGLYRPGLTRIAPKVSATLKSFDLDWRPTFQHAAEFDSAISLLSELKPNVILIANETAMSDAMLRQGCENLARALSFHTPAPWIAIEDEDLAHLVHIFEASAIKAFSATLVGVISDEEEARDESVAQ